MEISQSSQFSLQVELSLDEVGRWIDCVDGSWFIMSYTRLNLYTDWTEVKITSSRRHVITLYYAYASSSQFI